MIEVYPTLLIWPMYRSPGDYVVANEANVLALSRILKLPLCTREDRDGTDKICTIPLAVDLTATAASLHAPNHSLVFATNLT